MRLKELSIPEQLFFTDCKLKKLKKI